MVGPSQVEHEAVSMLMIEHSFGVTRACGVIGVSRSLFRYRSRRPDGSNPFLPREVGYYLPHLRHPMVTGGGLTVLEWTGPIPKNPPIPGVRCFPA